MMQSFKSPLGALVEYGDNNHFLDYSTLYVAKHLKIQQGVCAAEPGCGSGMLSVLAAKLGAYCVYATDMDPLAIEYARKNAQPNNTPQVKVIQGNLLDPVPEDVSLDVVIADEISLKCGLL